MRPALSLIPEVRTSAVASMVIREDESRAMEVPTNRAPAPMFKIGTALEVVPVREVMGDAAVLMRVKAPSPTICKDSGEPERVPVATTELFGAKTKESVAAKINSGAERVVPELSMVMLFAATERSPVFERVAPIRRLSAPQEVSVEDSKKTFPAVGALELFLMVKSRGAEMSIFAPPAPARAADFTEPFSSMAVCDLNTKAPESAGRRCVVIPSCAARMGRNSEAL